jgi:ribosomal protein L24
MLLSRPVLRQDLHFLALPIHASNVSPLDPKSNKTTRVGAKVVDGKRVRTATKSGQELK